MLTWDFVDTLTKTDIASLAALQVFFFVASYAVVKNRQWGFLDPFTLTLFFGASSWSIVTFLFTTGRCPPHLFVTFLLTNICFFFAYLMVAPKYSNASNVRPRDLQDAQTGKFMWLGASLSFMYLIFLGTNLWTFGFGISHETRLTIYAESQGLGFLKRVLDSLMPAVIFFLVTQTKTGPLRKRIFVYLPMTIIAGNSILDGSKSGIVQVALAVFVSYGWLRHWKYLPAPTSQSWLRLALLMLVALALAATVLWHQIGADLDWPAVETVGSILAFRLLLAGDVFLLGYPNAAVDMVPLTHHPLLILLHDPLSTLRVLRSDVTPLGNQLYNMALIGRELDAGGPNSHLSIYAYYLFGIVGGPILALLFGGLYGLIRRGILLARGGRLVAGTLYVSLLCNGSAILTDPSYSIHRLTNIALILAPIVLVFSLSLRPRHENRSRHTELV